MGIPSDKKVIVVVRGDYSKSYLMYGWTYITIITLHSFFSSNK